MTDGATIPRPTPTIARGPVALRIDDRDTVAVAVRPITAGDRVEVGGASVIARQDIPAGHKLALVSLEPEQPVFKYGVPIGLATTEIAPGDWIHSHNLKTALSGLLDYVYTPSSQPPYAAPRTPHASFQGFRRANGRVGTRNELWVLNTVGCVNHAAERIARQAAERFAGRLDGVHAFA